MSRRSTRAQVDSVRDAMRAAGAPTGQIATALAARLRVRPATAYRLALGLTQEQVAQRLNQRWPAPSPRTGKHISYWERWDGPGSTPTTSARPPSVDDLYRLAVLYGCTMDELAAPTTEPGGCDAPDGEVPARYAEQDDITFVVPTGQGGITVRLSRRDFTSLMATGGLAAFIPGFPELAHAEDSPRPWPRGEDPVGYFTRVLTGHQDGHHLLAPADHIALLNRRLRAMDTARRAAGPGARTRLRTVQTAYAEHISWLHKEAGDHGACVRWADQAAQWALETGDHPMVSYMLLRKSTLALDGGDYTTAVELAQAAERGPWPVPIVLKGAARLYQTRATAATGTFSPGQLEEAAGLITAGQNQDGPAYLRFYTPGFAEMQRASCLVDARRPQAAIGILRDRITTLPTTHRRDKAVYGARLAHAHATDRAPDAAADTALWALPLARDTGSRHAQTEISRVGRLLAAHWPEQPKVRQLRDALRDSA